jgi:integrase
MNDLTGRRLYEYRSWRKEDGQLKPVSLRTQLSTLRAFVRFCETIGAVHPDTHEEILLPPLDPSDEVREELLEPDRAAEIRSYLERFEYASRKHIIFELFWASFIRMGTLHSLDVDDFNPEARTPLIQHRPDEGTALKNRERAERLLSLPERSCAALTDWIEYTRPDVHDEYDRRPLVATQYGRANQNSIRSLMYNITRPCYYSGHCPCEQKYSYDHASQCPHSRSPHCLRKGSLTHLLKRDVPKEVVSDRADVSVSILDKHYNKMSEEEKMEQRRQYLDSI